MKIARKLFVLVITVSIALATSAAFAGVPPDPEPGAVPEPTAFLVWLGLAAAGGLLSSRRNRDER